MASDDRLNKFNNNSDELEYNDNVDQDNNDLDFDLLFNVMDELFLDSKIDQNPEIKNQTKSPSPESKTTQIVQQMYKLTRWENIENNSKDRPKLCSMCYTLTCDHIKNSKSRLNIEEVLESAIHKCEHEISEEWMFEEVCAKCIISSCDKVNSFPSVDLYVLWDEVDLIQYLQWIEKIDKEGSITN